MHYVMILSLAAGALYGLTVHRLPPSRNKTILKVSAVALLALNAAGMGAPWPLVLALVFSAVGDACLAWEGDKYLLPGMGAFFIAHALYIFLFLQLGLTEITPHSALFSGVLILSGAALVAYLWNSLEEMKLPVLAYAGVIVSMGICAVHLPGAYWPVMVGALMFIASDIILSFELFKPHVVGRFRQITSPLLWFLYFGGQVLIADGVITAMLQA